jgi:hypothetical protein
MKQLRTFAVAVTLLGLVGTMSCMSSGTPEGDESIDSVEAMQPGEELYVREETRIRKRVVGIPTGSELVATSELWIGDGRVALVMDGRTAIVDLRGGTGVFINHRNRTYVETAHPLDPSRAFPDDLAGGHFQPPTTAVVHETGDSVRVLDRECTGYETTVWDVKSGHRSNPRTMLAYATSDLPVDLAPYYALIKDMRVLFNRDARAVAELEKIEGVQLSVELRQGSVWSGTTLEERAVEIAARIPPADLYTVPAGYTRNDTFSRADF